MQGQTASSFKSYLNDRQKFCVVNGLSSVKDRIVCDVPQGSLLGPLLFLIYINDLPNCLDHSIGRSFADDTNLTFSAVDLSILQTEMSIDLNKIFNWLSSNKLKLNILKTDFMVIGSRQRIASLAGNISLSVNGLTLQQVETTKCLGLTIDQFLTWKNHLQSVRQKLGCGIRILKRIRLFVGLEHLIKVDRSIVEPYFTYCCIVWDSIGETLVDSLQKLQNKAARVTTGASYSKHSADIRHELGWLSVSEIRQYHMAVMMFKVNHGLCLSYLSDMFDANTSRFSYDLRSSRMNLIVPKVRTNYFRDSFSSAGAKLWNSLPISLKEQTLKQFKTKIKSYLLSTQAP